MADISILNSINLGSASVIGKYFIWFLLFLVICLAITAIVLMIVVKKTSTNVIEINMVNKRIRVFTGRNKKNKISKIKQFYASKIKRWLPNFQQEDIYSKGTQESVLLLKDNNGMYHTARIPTWDEIKKWYEVQYNIDLTNKDELKKSEKELKNIYLLPSPHEDLDWLASQAAEAEKEFNISHWWQSPAIAYIGVGFICFMMITITMIFG